MNKKAISELISYILLITLTIAIASGTYLWLKDIAVPPQKVECPDLNLIVINDTCFNPIFSEEIPRTLIKSGNISFWLQNKGKFDIDGFKIQISDKVINSIFYDISISKPTGGFFPKNEYLNRINSNDLVGIFGEYKDINTVKLIKIIPVKYIGGKIAYCKSNNFQINDCIDGAGGIPK